MIENLPAPVRHLAAVFIGVYVTYLAVAVSTANGVTGVDWPAELVGGLDKAAVAAVAVLVTLYITPLTNAYGVSKPVVEVPEFDELDDDEDEVTVDGEVH